MKAKALQFGKAMNAALFVLLLVVVGTKNALAQTQVATLQHGDELSAFYGSNALSSAYAAASTGDIITLSGGSYNTILSINKEITIRGTGWKEDTISEVLPTTINRMAFNQGSSNCTIEGLYITELWFSSSTIINNLKFIKCCIPYVFWNSSSVIVQNAQFINCQYKSISGTTSRFNNAHFINSVCYISCNQAHGANYNNSIVSYAKVNNSDVFCNISGINSVFISRNGNSCLPDQTCLFFNSIMVCADSFGQAHTQNCISYGSVGDVFETYTSSTSEFPYEDDQFVLKEEISSSFLGDDGTEVGIYGGLRPYKSRPNYMVLKRCNVANRSTIDGKLSVDIEVIIEE